MTVYNFPNKPYVLDQDWLRRQPFKHRTGREAVRSVMALASTVVADSDGRRLLPAGTVLCKITSGHAYEAAAPFYGPYTKDASDGRESIDAGSAVILDTGVEVTIGNTAVGGVHGFAEFDLDYIQDDDAAGDAVSKHGTTLTALEDAFPTCIFRT